MAKQGSLTIQSLTAPQTVQPGQEYEAVLTLMMTANQVPDNDPDRCNTSTACNVQNGGNGFCIQPYVRSPVDGTIKHPGFCVEAPESGSRTVDLTFQLTAPNEQAPESLFTIEGGFVLPGTAGSASAINALPGPGRPDFVGDRTTTRITIDGQVGAGGNNPPSVSTPNVSFKTGAARGQASASDVDGNITGFTWEWQWRILGTFGGNISRSDATIFNISGGNPSEARIPHVENLPEGDFADNRLLVRVTVHDAAGLTASAERVFNDTPAQNVSNIDAPPGSITDVSDGMAGGGVTVPGGGGGGINRNALLAVAALGAGVVLLSGGRREQ